MAVECCACCCDGEAAEPAITFVDAMMVPMMVGEFDCADDFVSGFLKPKTGLDTVFPGSTGSDSQTSLVRLSVLEVIGSWCWHILGFRVSTFALCT